jgi:hypothetical protein
MKLLLPIIVLFLCPPPSRRTPLAVTAELCLRPQKNQLHCAGFLLLRLSISRLILFFFPRPNLFPSPRSLQLTTQIPSSL